MFVASEYSRTLHSVMLIILPEFTCLSFAFIKSNFLWLFLCWLIFREKRRKKKKPLELIVTWFWLALWEMDCSKKESSISPGSWLSESAGRFHLESSPFPGSKACPRPPESIRLPSMHLSFPAKSHLRNFRAVLLWGQFIRHLWKPGPVGVRFWVSAVFSCMACL